MTHFSLHHATRRLALRHPRAVGSKRLAILGGASLAAFSLAVVTAVAPVTVPSEAETLHAFVQSNAQSLSVPGTAAASVVTRDTYTATPGIATLAAGGTNHDWAKLVLISGGFPMTDSNVTVILRWMRQENGPDNWFNRNNPLNNGYGSGGGGGTGRYENLVVAAQKAGESLNKFSGYSAIKAALLASAPTETIESAIWASPWASGHYHWGDHWSYAPVPAVKAPAEAWG